MEMALVNFIGAGIAAVSSGLGFTVPPSALRSGYGLVEYLSRNKPAETARLIKDITTDLWMRWDQGQVPRDVVKEPLEGLPLLLSNHCPPPNYFVNGLQNSARSVAAGALTAPGCGRLIAAEFIMRGRESNAFERAGLNEQICYFLCERLFERLLLSYELFEEMKPILQSYFLQKLWRDDAGQPVGPDQSGPAGPGAVKVPHQSTAVPPTAAQPIGAHDDIEGLSEPADLQAAFRRYSDLMKSETDAGARTVLQLQLGRLGVRIGKIAGDADQLENARQLISSSLTQPLLLDKAGIRRKAQIDLADALWELSRAYGNRDLLHEAAKVLDPICSSLRLTSDLSQWVGAHALLAMIYLDLSREISGCDELEKAAHHFEKAIERLSRTGQPQEWATMTNKLAYTLELISVRRSDHDILAQAAEVKRAAIDVFEIHGDSKLLETLRDELYAMHDEMQRLSQPGARAAVSDSADILLQNDGAADSDVLSRNDDSDDLDVLLQNV